MKFQKSLLPLTSHIRKYCNPLLFLVLFIIACPGQAYTKTEERPLPFRVGEKLTYKLRWGIIPAGKAVLEVLPPKEAGTCHFRLTAKTNAFIDTFYKVRDQIDSITNGTVTRSLRYIKKQREGKTHRDVLVQFDPDGLQATFINKVVKFKSLKSGAPTPGQPPPKNIANPPLPILQGTLDPLAALYYLRSINYSTVSTVHKPITDGKKNVIGVAKVLKQETLTIRGKKYNTYLVEPDLKDVRGVFEKSKDSKIKLWITADKRCLLVKMKSKVVVGSFHCVLIDAKNTL